MQSWLFDVARDLLAEPGELVRVGRHQRDELFCSTAADFQKARCGNEEIKMTGLAMPA